MSRTTRSNLVLGIILVLAGGLFLAERLIPGLSRWLNFSFTWPMIIIGVGVLLALFGLLVGVPDMLVPACIVGGIGGILAYQNASNNWASWSYLWTLIPGFVGVGVLLSGLIEGRQRAWREGGGLLMTSAVLFIIFAILTGGLMGEYWPLLIIAIGVWLLVTTLFRRR